MPEPSAGKFAESTPVPNPQAAPATLTEQGWALARQGQLAAAVTLFEQALQEQPEDLRARLGLAMSLTETGKGRDAMPAYRQVLEHDPLNVIALNNLACLLASHPDDALRNGKEAVQLAELACATASHPATATLPTALGTLASAYAEVGRFDDAVRTAKEAIARATAAGYRPMAQELEMQLRWYENGLPYREPRYLVTNRTAAANVTEMRFRSFR